MGIYSHLDEAIEVYENFGYTYVEDLPVLISPEAYEAARPAGCPPATVQGTGMRLAASAEQSFVQMMMDGAVFPYRSMALAPCVRRGYKLELFIKHGAFEYLEDMYNHASIYFFRYVDVWVEGREEGPEEIVTHGGIVLGSYEIRSNKDHSWTCGTGIEEPRLTLAMEAQK